MVVVVLVVVAVRRRWDSVEEWLVRSLEAQDTPPPALLFVRSLLDDEVGITTCSWNAATEGGRGS